MKIKQEVLSPAKTSLVVPKVEVISPVNSSLVVPKVEALSPVKTSLVVPKVEAIPEQFYSKVKVIYETPKCSPEKKALNLSPIPFVPQQKLGRRNTVMVPKTSNGDALVKHEFNHTNPVKRAASDDTKMDIKPNPVKHAANNMKMDIKPKPVKSSNDMKMDMKPKPAKKQSKPVKSSVDSVKSKKHQVTPQPQHRYNLRPRKPSMYVPFKYRDFTTKKKQKIERSSSNSSAGDSSD